MNDRRSWVRGTVALGVLAALVAAALMAPVSAAIKKKTVRRVASKLDARIAPRLAFARDDDLGFTTTEGDDDTMLLSTQIVAPAAGFLAINAGADVSLAGSAPYPQYTLSGCVLAVDGTRLGSSSRGIVLSNQDIDGRTQANYDEDCTTEGAVAVAPGTHTVQLRTTGSNAGATFEGAVLWAMWVPYDGSGNRPASFDLGRG